MRLKSLLTCTTLLLAATAANAQQLTTVRVASGLARPLFVTHAPNDYARAFIVEQRSGNIGRIRILDLATGNLLPTPFLSITVSTSSEQGLLGLAFHPDYETNGKFYVDYTDSGGTTRIVEYQVSSDPNVADPGSARILLSVAQPFTNHNGGWIGFGPDGYLYISLGDGGSANDPGNRAQNLTQYLGKMLRIDVDGGLPYAIPPDNPFAGSTALVQEIWAYGLRNAWRCSFDRATGDLWIGDVGQGAWEEIDFQPAGAAGGRNYGWRCMEGFNCTGLSGCTCNAPTLTMPIYQYSHSSGCSITGGYVYRGCAIPDLDGTYFFADYCTSQIWTFNYDGAVQNFANRTSELAPGGGLSISTIASFGEDAYGELYICDNGGGEVFKIIPRNGFVNGDCNGNNIDDACDIAAGLLADINADGIPDSCQCLGDLDSSNSTDLSDLGILLGCWSQPCGDLNADGTTDLADLGILLGNYNCNLN